MGVNESTLPREPGTSADDSRQVMTEDMRRHAVDSNGHSGDKDSNNSNGTGLISGNSGAHQGGAGLQTPPPTTATTPEYDPGFTDRVIRATGPRADPRLARVMPSLVRHLHDFAREVELTVDEWMAAVEMINEAGRMSDAKRNETGLLCDVVGLESLVDEITSLQQQRELQHQQTLQQQQQQQQQLLSDPGTTAPPTPAFAVPPTPSAILGPFYRAGAPQLRAGGCILRAPTREALGPDPGPDLDLGAAWAAHAASLARLARVSGRVLSARTGRPVARGATVEVWQAAPNGLYEQQDALQPDMNLRGRFVVAPDEEGREEEEAEKQDGRAGRYGFVCLRPTPYPVPGDGPAGRLLRLLDRQPCRPGHLHFVVRAVGYAPLTTQVFDGADPLVAEDSVFAVKRALCVAFEPFRPAGGAGAGHEARAAGGGNGDGDGRGGGGDGIDWEGERRKSGHPLPKWHLEFDFSLVEL